MSDDYLSDDQQIERFKALWQKWGNVIATVTLVIVLGVLAWQLWLRNEANNNHKLADQYMQVGQLALPLLEGGQDQKAYNLFMTKAQGLIKQDENHMFAAYTRLLVAKVAVGKQDWKQAETELSSLVANKGLDKLVKDVAAERLAQVQYQQGKLDAALASLASVRSPQFMVASNELKGDILQDKKDSKGAQAAYQAAYDVLAKRGESRDSLIAKMQAVGLSPEPIQTPELLKP